jgi:DNA-binding ferritin-like protein
MADLLLKLAVHYRTMYLYSVHAHQFAARSVFHQDHEFFNEIYDMMEGFYDSVTERQIGLFGEESFDTVLITSEAVKLLSNMKTKDVKENKEFYVELLADIKGTLSMLEVSENTEVTTVGTANMLADQADKLETLVYKISRRIK